jgi:quinol monooxygenase YgiN
MVASAKGAEREGLGKTIWPIWSVTMSLDGFIACREDATDWVFGHLGPSPVVDEIAVTLVAVRQRVCGPVPDGTSQHCGECALVTRSGTIRLTLEAIMILIVQHTVRDYDAWKPVFDEHESVRAKYGCLGHTIYRDADKPEDLMVFIQCESRERAEGILRDPSLAASMERGGVLGEPRVTWLAEAETSSYVKRRAA